MANVRKLTRPDGSRFYQVRWRTPDGKHRTKGGFRTKKAAEDYANDVDHSQLRGTMFDPKPGQLRFREAARRWLDGVLSYDTPKTKGSRRRVSLTGTRATDANGKRIGLTRVLALLPESSLAHLDRLHTEGRASPHIVRWSSPGGRSRRHRE
ncbi:MAG: Arm DNA-binding domain-containing protein [Rhodococcus sp. (in: high G+C Gram-positive bacteria)]